MKIAAYCRVSTDKEDQANSFESQQRFFYEYITGHPDWSLFEIYADEGITGTSVKKRTAFQRMMRDAEHRCFDLIVTKEISRFARNTLDSIYYTRKLKSLGVGVLFLNDNLNTLQEDSELILAIKSTIAQEESRATSSRVKWGQTRRMEQGVVFGRSLLGYDVVGGKMIVNPEGAAIVRLIFHKYVTEQKGSTTIARELERAGIPTLTGSTRWRSSVILKILRNEKYCGDLKQKKTITPDYLTHRKKYNHGEEAFVFLKDHHEPIVSREVWEQAQRELQRRNVKEDPKTGHGNRYPLSGKSAAEYAERALYPVAASEKMGARIGYGVAGLPPQAHSRLPSWAAHRDVMLAASSPTNWPFPWSLWLCTPWQWIETPRFEKLLIWQPPQKLKPPNPPNTKQLQRELESLYRKKKRILDSYFEDTISNSDLQLMNKEYDQRIKVLSERLQTEGYCTVSGNGVSSLEANLYDKICCAIESGRLNCCLCHSLLDYICVYSSRQLRYA